MAVVGLSPAQPPRFPELSAEGLAVLGERNACERESVHLSGAIQPNGFLLVVDASSLVVTAASANFPPLVDRASDPLGLPLKDILGPTSTQALLATAPTGNPHDCLPVQIHLSPVGGVAEQPYDMIAHRRGPVLVLEFQKGDLRDGSESARFFQQQRDAVRALLTLDQVDEICARVVVEVQKLTGYDRVMVYRFEPDAHGQVIAEACAEDAEPFLGLHYPASDIPRQARALYMRNWIRVITDVDYVPVPIEALPGGIPADQIDLSLAVLRSVSPVHLQYLRNMGVGGTMTISLMVDNQLWGMISCHHRTPMYIDHVHRLACEALGQLVSVRLRAAEAATAHEQFRSLSRMAAQVITAMAAAENLARGALAAAPPLLEMAGADGVVVEVDGVQVALGKVPGAEVLDVLLPHFASLSSGGLHPLAIDSVGASLGVDTELDLSSAAGALFLALPGRVEGFVLWVRGEWAQTVRWAGRPELKPDGPQGAAALTPRASFGEWLEEVRGRSRPWLPAEIAAATELAQAMPEVLMHRAQNRLVRLALHDPLTGLPNRVLLNSQLDELLRRRRVEQLGADSNRQVGVLFIDVDGFKAVNDSLGHLAGDELLNRAARRMTSVTRPQDVVARMGGDEFVVLLPDADAVEAADVAQRLVEDFRRTFRLADGVSRTLSVSVGVTVVSRGAEPSEAIRQADAAMYHAKRAGRDQVAVYDPTVGTAASRAQLARDELKAAIATREITVYYQPILALSKDGTTSLHGFEALARWEHPTRGVVPPEQFIGVAEETGLIDELGDDVMLQALRELVTWPDRTLSMAINVSVRQLIRPDFATDVIARLVELGVAPSRLCLEITESQIMEQPELALAALVQLDAVGVRIGIDDFGTGYSSMAYIRDLPATHIKIDQLFVSGLPTNHKDVAVVAATVRLAHSLNMSTVAEGVETAEQLAHLREVGCDYAQGYFIGRPLPPDAVRLDWSLAGARPSGWDGS